MIELKVEEYCHDCPEFDAECCEVYANGHIERTMVKCANAAKCSRIRRYLSDGYNEPKPEPTTAGPIKSFDLCMSCVYGWTSGTKCECRKRDADSPFTDDVCVGCPLHIGGKDNCACCTIDLGDPCPYYKEAKND